MARRSPGLARRLPFGASAVIEAPSCSPALEAVTPADTGQEWVLGAGTEVEVMLSDGTWTRATLRARGRDARGRWCVLLCWLAGPAAGQREGWFVYDGQLIRRPRKNRKAPTGSPAPQRQRAGRSGHGSSATSDRGQRRANRR